MEAKTVQNSLKGIKWGNIQRTVKEFRVGRPELSGAKAVLGTAGKSVPKFSKTGGPHIFFHRRKGESIFRGGPKAAEWVRDAGESWPLPGDQHGDENRDKSSLARGVRGC